MKRMSVLKNNNKFMGSGEVQEMLQVSNFGKRKKKDFFLIERWWETYFGTFLFRFCFICDVFMVFQVVFGMFRGQEIVLRCRFGVIQTRREKYKRK